ncbi:MAG: hypothetical protein RBS38_14210 [Bacteroidales bacterium]|jgi:hypothetical protein|nr:hypothetical protein [Bacteroidales bacterium]
MKPDRSNYEIWLTDWLDGNLSDQQAEELRAFLRENPDLGEEMNSLATVSLKPPKLGFRGKQRLLKPAALLSETQFEHLCIAKLENDLSPEQTAEIDELTGTDELRKKEHDLIMGLKLTPQAITYRHKGRIRKLTPAGRIFRISLVSLSAAATIAVAISLMLKFTLNPPAPDSQASVPAAADTITIEAPLPFLYTRAEQLTETSATPIQVEPRQTVTEILTEPVLPDPEPPVILMAETDFERFSGPEMIALSLPENVIETERPSQNSLIEYKPGYIPPLIENRSNVELFMARLFHEKIMNDKTAGTKPVERFDIARAGILGLNKLFGWELALDRNTDINGNTSSYYFASRLVKVNAPVRKPAESL